MSNLYNASSLLEYADYNNTDSTTLALFTLYKDMEDKNDVNFINKNRQILYTSLSILKDNPTNIDAINNLNSILK